MASIGHGISDAVRNHISLWIDDNLIESMYETYRESGGTLNKSAFCIRVRQSKDWVRKSRKNTKSGYERLYQCKTVQKSTLIVHSPPTDASANGYVFYVDGKLVGGGKTLLKSTHISKAISKTDKSSTSITQVQYVKFSEDELRKFKIQTEYGDGFASFEVEREA